MLFLLYQGKGKWNRANRSLVCSTTGDTSDSESMFPVSDQARQKQTGCVYVKRQLALPDAGSYRQSYRSFFQISTGECWRG